MPDLSTEVQSAACAAVGQGSEILGSAAGACLLASSVPQLVRNILVPGETARQSFLRNWLIVSGNVIWVAYGLNNGAVAIAVTCTISAVLNGAILVQMSVASPPRLFRRNRQGALLPEPARSRKGGS